MLVKPQETCLNAEFIMFLAITFWLGEVEVLRHPLTWSYKWCNCTTLASVLLIMQSIYFGIAVKWTIFIVWHLTTPYILKDFIIIMCIFILIVCFTELLDQHFSCSLVGAFTRYCSVLSRQRRSLKGKALKQP